jgi:hypothetical protein
VKQSAADLNCPRKCPQRLVMMAIRCRLRPLFSPQVLSTSETVWREKIGEPPPLDAGGR